MHPLIGTNEGGNGEMSSPRALDERLVRDVIAGSATAFEMLVTRHRRIVLSIARRLTGSFDDAEDLTQQTFMKAFLGLSKFRFGCAFSSWLVSIALNEARMWNRRRWRSCEIPMLYIDFNEDVALSMDYPDRRPNPEASYSQLEITTILHSAISRLKPAVRIAIQACDLDEEPIGTTARKLGVGVSAVKSRRSRGRAALRRILGAHGPARKPMLQPECDQESLASIHVHDGVSRPCCNS